MTKSVNEIATKIVTAAKSSLHDDILDLFKESEDLITDLPKSHISNGVRTIKNMLYTLESITKSKELDDKSKGKFYSMIKLAKKLLGQIQELDNPESFADVEDFLGRILKLQTNI